MFGNPKKLLGQFFVCPGHIVQGKIQAYDADNGKKVRNEYFVFFSKNRHQQQ
jgi:hypothetical protein